MSPRKSSRRHVALPFQLRALQRLVGEDDNLAIKMVTAMVEAGKDLRSILEEAGESRTPRLFPLLP